MRRPLIGPGLPHPESSRVQVPCTEPVLVGTSVVGSLYVLRSDPHALGVCAFGMRSVVRSRLVVCVFIIPIHALSVGGDGTGVVFIGAVCVHVVTSGSVWCLLVGLGDIGGLGGYKQRRPMVWGFHRASSVCVW